MILIAGIIESFVFWVVLFLLFILIYSTILFVVDGINYYLKFKLLSWITFFGLIYLSISHIHYVAVFHPHRWDGWYGVLLIFGYYFVFQHFYKLGHVLYEKEMLNIMK